ncbi:MAG: beta-ketoacyl synthase N-terminal-like domain-containing protein [Chthoniobacterales bacterium]
MRLAIAGCGWVTPMGSSVRQVWQRLLAGESAQAESIATDLSDRAYPVFRVPAEAGSGPPAHARLRRSSAISRFAAGAGMAALEDAGLTIGPGNAARIALIFATSNGGVIYTKRFYHDIVATGAEAASPLLFPETVFNAPASHLAAILGISGTTYTLVGDGAVGLLALQVATDLMRTDGVDYCLVVAAEEADWLLCDAYRNWRLLRDAPPIEPFRSPRGMILSEGAGAMLLAREGPVLLEKIVSGKNFQSQGDAAAVVSSAFEQVGGGTIDAVVTSANGTFIDAAEQRAVMEHCPTAAIYAPKPALGEGVSAATMWQMICAVEILLTNQIPPVLHGPPKLAERRKLAADSPGSNSVIVSACGLNQQTAAARLTLAR